MKLAVSNIAWNPEQNDIVINLLKKYQYNGIEVAPSKIWKDMNEVTPSNIKEQENFWEKNGFTIESVQAILFGKPKLTIFDSSESRKKTLNYLYKVIDISSELGAKKIVFGSPKNRVVPENMKTNEATDIAIEFFSKLSDYCKTKKIYLCMEANPKQYGANFITNNSECIKFVKQINHPNFRLQLDTGIMFLNSEDYAKTITECLPYTAHLHISEPNLDPIGNHTVDHKTISDILKKNNYNEWASIEMRLVENDNWIKIFENSLKVVSEIYG